MRQAMLIIATAGGLAGGANADFTLDMPAADAVRGLGGVPFKDLAIGETALMFNPECVLDGSLYIDGSQQIVDANSYTDRMRVTLQPGRKVAIIVKEVDESPRDPSKKRKPLESFIRSLTPHHIDECKESQSADLIPVATVNGYSSLSELLQSYQSVESE